MGVKEQASRPEPNRIKVKMQYIGACALLGRLASRITNVDDRDSIERAMGDCCDCWPDALELVKTSGGGFSIEVKP